MMKNTVFAAVGSVDREAILASIDEPVAGVQQYVPGYRLKTEPIFDEDRITVFVEVEGAGAYLPKYAGNLDIETAAAFVSVRSSRSTCSRNAGKRVEAKA